MTYARDSFRLAAADSRRAWKHARRSGQRGRITGASTKKTSAAVASSLASGVSYQPMSNLLRSYTYGNGLTEADAHTLDYEQSS